MLGKTVYTGAWRWLPLDSELRQDGANLNPELIESTAAEHNWQYHEADEGKPEYKDNAFMRDAAAKGDQSYREGLGRRDAAHTVRLTGVLASHPPMKLLYWDDIIMRQPDPMHTIGNELKALAEMLMGGTGKTPVYSTARMPQLAEHEIVVNERWAEILTGFLQAGAQQGDPPQASQSQSKAKGKGGKAPAKKARGKKAQAGARPVAACDLPWACSDEQLQSLRAKIFAMHNDPHSCMSTGLASVSFAKAFGSTGALKTSEYLLLAGPIGKYIMQDCLHATQQRIVFQYLDLLGSLWEKSITLARLAEIEEQLPQVLTEMECHLPTWECNINRHMMLHLVEAIRQNGPCWTWSMFGYERFWNRLMQWMSQRSHPEATMMNAFKAFTTICLADPTCFSNISSDVEDQAHGGAACTPFGSLSSTFDRSTYELRLPEFLQQRSSVHWQFKDGKVQTFGISMRPDPNLWRAELHLLYLAHPDLCGTSVTAYNHLWQAFLRETGQRQAPKAMLSKQLDAWRLWGERHKAAGSMDAADALLCNGPVCSVRVYDRASAGTVMLTGTRLEGSKKAKDSLIMIWDDDEDYQAGRVQAFLSHRAPGSTSTDINDETSIAWVHWYKRVPSDQPSVDPDLQCPIFGRALNANEPLGNFCLCERLLPCKLACFPYNKFNRAQVVVVSRFASFLQALPKPNSE